MTSTARLLVLVLAVVLLPAAPAAAAACPPPGGVHIPAATPEDGDFRIAGRGWGHGVGMSQYGAQGAGLLGCSGTQILTTYFPGTHLGPATPPSNVRVSLDTDARTIPVAAQTGPIPWELCTSTCQQITRQPAGATWTVAIQSDGTYRLMSGATEVWRGGSSSARMRLRLDGLIARVQVATNYRYRWGSIELASRADAPGTAFVTAVLPMEQYLYGLSEMPSSWPAATLRAQAVAGRSYAQKRADLYRGNRTGCRCDLYATVVDQHFTGYEKAAEAGWGHRWVQAVDATRGTVLRHGSTIADTFYSSSHGGASESSRFVWGGTVSYLQPLDDSRWEQASTNPSGNLTWSRTLSAAALGDALDVGRALRVDLPEPKGHGGRIGDPARGYGGVVVTGTAGTRTLSGDAFRRALGLKSTLFTVEGGGPEWSEWTSQPGTVADALDAVSWADGRTDVFGVDGAGVLVHRWHDEGRPWAPSGGWEGLGHPPGLRLVGQPAAVARGPAVLNVFARASDDALWQRWFRRGTGWSGWQRLGGTLASSPAVTSWSADHIAVFATGPDGRVHQRSFAGGWSAWQPLAGAVTSAPGATSWGPGRIDLFARGTDGSLQHRYFDGGRWVGGWASKGGGLHGSGRPEAVSWGHGRLDVFVVGHGGEQVYRKSFERGLGWLPDGRFEPLGAGAPALRSGTGAVSWHADHLEVFSVDTGGRVWHRWMR